MVNVTGRCDGLLDGIKALPKAETKPGFCSQHARDGEHCLEEVWPQQVHRATFVRQVRYEKSVCFLLHVDGGVVNL